MHSTAEELAAHFWNEALQAFSPKFLQDRGVRVGVSYLLLHHNSLSIAALMSVVAVA